MTHITTTIDLPHGWHRWTIVTDEAEAIAIAAGRKSYLFRSQIIQILYLIVPEEER